MLRYWITDEGLRRFILHYGINDVIYYGFIALAAFSSIFLIYRKLRAYDFDQTKLKRFYIIATVLIYPLALVGSRLPDMFYKPYRFWSAEMFITQIWRGGTYTFHGGLIFSAIVPFCVMTLMKFTSLEKWRMADAAFLYIPLCHPIGRAGCLILGCCWGERMTFSIGGYDFKFQNPAPLYSILGMLAIFLVLRALHNYVYSEDKRLMLRGLPTAFYFVLYGALRFFMETIRTNRIIAWGLTQAQIAMVVYMLFGTAILLTIAFRFAFRSKANGGTEGVVPTSKA